MATFDQDVPALTPLRHRRRVEHELLILRTHVAHAPLQHARVAQPRNLVMDFIRGADAASILRDHGPMPIRTAVRLVYQVLKGLAHAHAKGFVHRDVKPGNLLVTPFSKSHDADDPHSFMISSNNINIGVITDIGYACKQVIKYFKQCDVAFLEANYCADMLENGNYPYHLKKRISSQRGHLSNDQALELFNQYRSDKLSLLILSHLSKNNNSPELVEKIFSAHAGHTKIIVASRYRASAVFTILPQTAKTARVVSRNKAASKKAQLSLF